MAELVEHPNVKTALELEPGDVIERYLEAPPNSMYTGRVETTVAVDNGLQINLSMGHYYVVAEDAKFEVQLD